MSHSPWPRRALAHASFIICALILVAARPAAGATYIVPSDEALIRKAGVIVRGRVLATTAQVTSDGGIETSVTIEVERVLKGHVDAPTLIVRHPGGRVGDRSDVYPGIGEFAVDETVVLMLDGIPGRPFRVTDFAVGKFRVQRGDGGREILRRDGLRDAHILGGPSIAADGMSSGPEAARIGARRFQDPDRDSSAFEDFVRGIAQGAPVKTDYVLPEQTQDLRVAAFEFLGSPPARWVEFDSGQTITYKDNSTGDAGDNCQPGGCHGEVATGITRWNDVENTQILLAYGGTDASIGSKCLNALHNQIQYGDSASNSCNDMSPLSGCSGTLAIGGFTSSGSGGSPSCPAKGNPSFERITSGKIMINKRTGDCLSPCDYTETIAHETGHTLGAGHSPDEDSLMNAYIQTGAGLCGVPRSDDEGFAQCAYPYCGLSASSTWGGPPPLVVSFQSGLAGAVGPLTYEYDFGDGTTDSSSTPTHSYSGVGTYTVTVTISDGQGHDCTTETEVTVQPCDPPLTESAKAKDGAEDVTRAIIKGRGFKKGVIVEIDAGGGFVPVPVTKRKTGRKILAKDIDETLWPPGKPVAIRVVGPAPTSCPSNPVSAIR